MNFFVKQKAWFFIALFSLVVNVILLGNFWRHRCGRHHRPADGFQLQEERPDLRRASFLKEKLALTAEQGLQLDNLFAAIRLQKDSIRKTNEQCKFLFDEELCTDLPRQQKLDSLADCISTSTESYNRVRVSFVTQLRTICTAEQRKKLPAALKEVAKQRRHFWGRKQHSSGETN